MNTDLSGKVAIVTGGAGGIGSATAKLLASEGAIVAVVDVNLSGLETCVNEIIKSGGKAKAYQVDLASEDEIRNLFDQVVSDFGRIDILFNNAGIIKRKTCEEISALEWDQVFDVNVRAIFLMCKYAIPFMRKAGGGSIINTGSGWGLKGGGRALSYCASKGAVVNMTRALAIDHGSDNIRVNSINPGDTNTPMLVNEANQLGQDIKLFLNESAERPLNRMGEPIEIARVVLFLASEASSFVTGAALVVDGGGIA
jgi:NAD(P)-dependent dehydrogenase (short-subunit alcohol dehydrogenase family)